MPAAAGFGAPGQPGELTKSRPRRLPLGLSLLFEDSDLLVVDKPSGLLSVAAGAEKDRTVYWALCEYLRKKGEKRRVAAVHRLDRDTSGLLVFAKSEEMKREFMLNWNDRVVSRRYIALAVGTVEGAEGLIDQALGEDASGRMVVSAGGMPARTRWKALGAGSGFTLLSLELETGRRNQIRAHLCWFGFPVAGDGKYGSPLDPLGRLALHAETLSFLHPRSGKRMTFESPAPSGFFAAINPSRGR